MKNNYEKVYMAKCEEFSVGDEVIYFEYGDNVSISEIDDGYFIEVLNIKQTYNTSIKKIPMRDGYYVQFYNSLRGKSFVVIKHPFSNDCFTGTEFLTYIETDDYIIRKIRLNGSLRIPKSIGDNNKELFIIPLFGDETEIFENEDNVVIRSFCEELFTRPLKKTKDGYYNIHMPPSLVGLSILLIKPP